MKYESSSPGKSRSEEYQRNVEQQIDHKCIRGIAHKLCGFAGHCDCERRVEQDAEGRFGTPVISNEPKTMSAFERAYLLRSTFLEFKIERCARGAGRYEVVVDPIGWQ